jgi:endonuclease/exonuclease/phosphatase family metal-dependent hydrolase
MDSKNGSMRGAVNGGRFRRFGSWIALALLSTVWILNTSRVGSPEGCPENCAKVALGDEPVLRVMSLNVLHGFSRFENLPERLALIAEEIRSQDVDIVLLQEIPWTLRLGNGAKYLSDRTGLNFLYLRANGNRWTILFEEGEAILSRYPLSEPVFAELRPRSGFFEHRVVLVAKASTPWGEIWLCVTHLTDGKDAYNRDQANSLMTFVEGLADSPKVIAGDFNALEDSPQIQALNHHWVDTYRSANPVDDGYTCCVDDLSADPSERLEKRIDYIFLAPGSGSSVRVVSSQRVLKQPFRRCGRWLWASDHIGLLTIIELDQ